jgi:hypothetical protein
VVGRRARRLAAFAVVIEEDSTFADRGSAQALHNSPAGAIAISSPLKPALIRSEPYWRIDI